MNDEIIDKLRRLHQHTTELTALLAAVQSKSPPQQAVGTDARGSVQVAIGADGLPTVIEVAGDWQRRVEPQDLGRSVRAAYEDAVAAGQRAWAAGFDDDAWAAEVNRVRSRDRDRPDGAELVPVLGPGREPLALNEELLKALHAARTSSNTSPQPAAGSNWGRTVSISLTPQGLDGCEIEARWVVGQPVRAVNGGLAEALREARAVLQDRVAHQQAEAENLATLAQDALATLARLTSKEVQSEVRR
ncbi:hypothetical protein [Micromonospora sp. SH-82]|uniref:hypothetical protein n=1 Tax=Micromonospora sp. SH-82 TaxID=3132938 RepID=UPI003EB9FBC2